METHPFFHNRKYRFAAKLATKKNIPMKHFKLNLRKYILPTWKVNSDHSVTGLG